MVNRKPRTNKVMLKAISHMGTPKGSRIIIETGDVKGIIDSQKLKSLPGSCMIQVARIKLKIIGMVRGNMNCWVSVSESTAAPTAANNAPYIK